LERNKEIRYYKEPTDTVAKGSISLLNATLYAHVEKKTKEMDNYFNIRVANRDFLLRAATVDEKNEWVQAIKSNIVIDTSGPEEKKRNDQIKFFLGSSQDLNKQTNAQ